VPYKRIAAIKQAIHDYDERFPQFQKSDYQATSEEAEERTKYLALKRDLEKTYTAAAFKQFRDKANEDRTVTDRILAQSGPGQPPKVIEGPTTTTGIGAPGKQKLRGETGSHSAASAAEQTRAAIARKGFDGLGQKETDLSQYFGAANLTERQAECASMKWEYGLSDRQIAERLGLHHKTVQESLRAANGRLARDEKFKQALKRRAARHGSYSE
jgi:hypothetical protein